MATGEYAAAWDARNAADKLREMERVAAENRHLDAPESTLATAQLLARHDQEARDLLAEQRVRAARLEREIQSEIERRGVRRGDTNPGGAVGGATMGRWLDIRDARTEHQTRWTQRETARMDAPGTLPTPAPTPPTRASYPNPNPEPSAALLAPPGRRRPGALASFLAATGDPTPFEAPHAGLPRPTTLGAGASMALTLSAYTRDAATFEAAPAPAPAPAAGETGVEIPSPERSAEETPRPHSPRPHSPARSVDREEYVFGRRRTWTRAPEAPENHRGTPRVAKLPPRSSLPPSLVIHAAGTHTRGPDDAGRVSRPVVNVPPLDFRAVLRDAEVRARTHARVRGASARAAAARGYGEYVDGGTGGLKTGDLKTGDLKTGALKTGALKTGALKEGKEARSTRLRGFTTGHDEPARGSDLEGVGGVGRGATDGASFLRAGEAEGDGGAPSEHSSDLSDDASSDDASDASDAGNAEVWSAPPERLREALTDPGGGGGGARRELRAAELRAAARREGPGLDVAVARVFRGAAAAEEVREAADGKENVDGGGGGGGGGGGEGAKSAAAKGRAPTGSFFRERRGPRAHGASLPSNTAGHTATRVRT